MIRWRNWTPQEDREPGTEVQYRRAGLWAAQHPRVWAPCPLPFLGVTSQESPPQRVAFPWDLGEWLPGEALDLGCLACRSWPTDSIGHFTNSSLSPCPSLHLCDGWRGRGRWGGRYQVSPIACTTMQQHTTVTLTALQSSRAFPLSFQNEYLQTGGSYCQMFPGFSCRKPMDFFPFLKCLGEIAPRESLCCPESKCVTLENMLWMSTGQFNSASTKSGLENAGHSIKDHLPSCQGAR